MKNQCFTCKYKLVKSLTEEERDHLKWELKQTKKYPRIPNMLFYCELTSKRINQTDVACENYDGDSDLVDIRKMISDTAKKLRLNLNNN